MAFVFENESDDEYDEEYYEEYDEEYDDDIEVDGLKKGYKSKEREFWSHYYDLLTRLPDHRKDLLCKFEKALINITDDGKINWTLVDTERIVSKHDGYTKALSYIVQDVKDLADALNIAQSELDKLRHLAKCVKKHRKFIAKDGGHIHALKEWSEIVQGLKPIRA